MAVRKHKKKSGVSAPRIDKRSATRRRTKGATTTPRQPFGRDDWIAAARIELIEGGVSAVKIGRLARRLRVTRGGFYWHFTSRQDLLRSLLESWEHANTAPFERVLVGDGGANGAKEFLQLANLWLRESEFVPAYDTAVRDWARASREAAAAVRRVDQRRIAVLHRIFLDLEFAEPEATVRARITYFHQIGYYALDLHEDRERRRTLAPIYLQVLSGLPMELIVQALATTDSTQ